MELFVSGPQKHKKNPTQKTLSPWKLKSPNPKSRLYELHAVQLTRNTSDRHGPTLHSTHPYTQKPLNLKPSSLNP